MRGKVDGFKSGWGRKEREAKNEKKRIEENRKKEEIR